MVKFYIQLLAMKLLKVIINQPMGPLARVVDSV